MALCGNRPEGFSLHSKISSPFPTTCFTDVILMPLPVWVALALLPPAVAFGLRRRKIKYNPSTAHMRTKLPRNCLYAVTLALYYIFILCNVLMQTLEIARLALLDFGVGLLPFVYVGLIIGGLLHWSDGANGRVMAWQAVNAVIWVGGIILCVIKAIAVSKEGIDGRKHSKYPVSDQVIDVAVIAGVYVAIVILEGVLWFWEARRSSRSMSTQSDASGLSPVMKDAEF